MANVVKNKYCKAYPKMITVKYLHEYRHFWNIYLEIFLLTIENTKFLVNFFEIYKLINCQDKKCYKEDQGIMPHKSGIMVQ